MTINDDEPDFVDVAPEINLKNNGKRINAELYRNRMSELQRYDRRRSHIFDDERRVNRNIPTLAAVAFLVAVTLLIVAIIFIACNVFETSTVKTEPINIDVITIIDKTTDFNHGWILTSNNEVLMTSVPLALSINTNTTYNITYESCWYYSMNKNVKYRCVTSAEVIE